MVGGQTVTDAGVEPDNEKTLNTLLNADISDQERLCLIDLHRRSTGIIASGYMYYTLRSNIWFVPGGGMKYLDHWTKDGIVYMETQTYTYFMIPAGKHTYECEKYAEAK